MPRRFTRRRGCAAGDHACISCKTSASGVGPMAHAGDRPSVTGDREYARNARALPRSRHEPCPPRGWSSRGGEGRVGQSNPAWRRVGRTAGGSQRVLACWPAEGVVVRCRSSRVGRPALVRTADSVCCRGCPGWPERRGLVRRGCFLGRGDSEERSRGAHSGRRPPRSRSIEIPHAPSNRWLLCGRAYAQWLGRGVRRRVLAWVPSAAPAGTGSRSGSAGREAPGGRCDRDAGSPHVTSTALFDA
jgi:hypothetical protein